MFKNVLVALVIASSSAYAHSAIMSCFDNGDGTVTCEGGFSDGSSASGVKFHVDQGGKKIISGKLMKTVNLHLKNQAVHTVRFLMQVKVIRFI